MWKVVIADDESFVREGLKEMIPWEKLGYQLEGTFKNGKEVIEAIGNICPDIVILDVQMPIMNGLDAAKYIRQHWPDIVVLILTAYEDFKYAQESIVLQVKRYVVKSNLLEDLPKVLQEIAIEMKEENRLEKRRMETFKMLLEESEYMEAMAEDSINTEWFKEKFNRFRIIVLKGYKREKEIGSILKQSTIVALDELFENHDIFVMNTTSTECVIVISDDLNLNKDVVTKTFGLFCDDEKDNFFVGISEVYEGIRNISVAYRNVWFEMKKKFFDSGTEQPGVIVIGPKNRSNDDELIDAIHSFIDDNVMKKINLDLIAQAVHANRCYVSRIYKERTGQKLFETINRKKVEIAKKLIEERKMKIYEIAGAVGWEDTAYFSRVFKKYTGYSPKEYERLYRR